MASYEEVMKEWYRDSRLQEISHARAAAAAQSWRRNLGLASAIASLFVGGSIFATLEATPGTNAKLTAMVLSFISGGLAVVLAFLKDSDAFQQHKEAEKLFDALRREVEELLATKFASDDLWKVFGNDFRERLKQAKKDAPTCAQKFVNAADRRIRKRPALLQ